MNRTFHWAWIAALSMAGAGAALAADDAAKPDPGAQGKATTATQQQTRSKGDQAGGGNAGSAGSRANSDTRNWAEIDADKDGLVSGDEMEKYLQSNTNAKK